MKKHSLHTNGLSLSQAQSISNLCFQRTQDIESELFNLNNVEKTLKIGAETYVETSGKPIPSNIIELIKEKATLHATQAFLMENIKMKDTLLKEEKTKKFNSPLLYPDYPSLNEVEEKELVDESWGWGQLSVIELNEYYEAEAYASHIGQFIHKNSVLDKLRKELPTLKTLEWITVKDGEKTPLKVKIHHTQEQLLGIHNELASLHRKYEQKVNYYKAKVKNLVTQENAHIAKENADEYNRINAINKILLDEYQNNVKDIDAQNLKLKQVFEQERQGNIKNIASLRINVDSRFQSVIDLFLKDLSEEK
jgi:hypothetical protein